MRGFAETKAPDGVVKPRRADLVAQPDGARVEALLQQLRHRRHAVGAEVPVLEGVAALLDHAGVVVGRVRVDEVEVDGRRHGDDLEHGAGLVEVGDGAVAVEVQLRAVQGELGEPEAGTAGHGEDGAGLRLHDDDRAARGLVVLDLLVELVLDQALDVAVDGEADVGAGAAGLGPGAAEGDWVAAAVALEIDGAGHAAEHVPEGGLDAGEAGVLAAEGAEDAGGGGGPGGRRRRGARGAGPPAGEPPSGAPARTTPARPSFSISWPAANSRPARRSRSS